MTARRYISRRERLRIFQRADGTCHICGQRIHGGYDPWEVEHVIALTKGGDDGPMSENLQPAHVSCHRRKSAEDAAEKAKGDRMQQREMGIRREPRNPLPGGRRSKWKRKISGEVVKR